MVEKNNQSKDQKLEQALKDIEKMFAVFQFGPGPVH